MASRLNPYITFAGTAREAMEFYQSALGGELAMNTFAEYGASGPGSDQIMHANLATLRRVHAHGVRHAAGDGGGDRQQHHDQPERRRRRPAAWLLGEADRGRRGH